jgi:hypothetical protein
MLFCIEMIDAQDTIPDIILKGHQYMVYCIDISKIISIWFPVDGIIL